MTCEHWTEKLDTYVDGELPSDQARAVDAHLRGCSTCAAEALRRVQLRRAVQEAGQRFTPDPAFRARMQKKLAARVPSSARWRWLPAFATAAVAVLLIASAFVLITQRNRLAERQLISELVDQHVATLASSSPVDVISSDRHTVKPWFQGKIPFTFNLPELQGSPFVLIGGRVTYLDQSPGAELIFRVRQHQISVFIFQERGLSDARVNQAMKSALSFEVRSWDQNGLRYFVVGDASPQDLDKLSEMLKAAG
jgi:anti-sigma factor RsiW